MSAEKREAARPGLQWERTRLAWDRTALSFAAFGALLMHLGHGGSHLASLGLGVGTLCSGWAVHVLGRRRYRRGVSLRDRGVASRRGTLAVVSVLSALTAVLSGVQTILFH
ncbi:hypothetical protein GCM10023191_051670 [Actinoallomurus oryzae]|uniref:DUF202 domain-containing protein n=1 Tax=Actinoallomurus oryzae TaxID=502180 RepID=A0ABP8QG71_9ACTN